jgi:type I restriction enzyme S subunit
MNAELLLTHFNRISDAPDAVPRLRQFVLELAVRGKLVDRNPSDEFAATLLKRIQSETSKRVVDGKTKPSSLWCN